MFFMPHLLYHLNYPHKPLPTFITNRTIHLTFNYLTTFSLTFSETNTGIVSSFNLNILQFFITSCFKSYFSTDNIFSSSNSKKSYTEFSKYDYLQHLNYK